MYASNAAAREEERNLRRSSIRFAWVLIPAIMISVAAYGYQREDHKAYRELPFPECAECHKDSGVQPNHGGGWDKEHRVMASRPDALCAQCHDQGTCQDCHKGGGINAKLSRSQYKRDIKPESHRSDWLSVHPVMASTNPQQCARCHEPQFCSNCHTRLGNANRTIRDHNLSAPAGSRYVAAFPDGHASEARRNLASCQSCHPDGNVCLTCHSARAGLRVNPHPKDFKADRIRSKSNNRSCRVCHDF